MTQVIYTSSEPTFSGTASHLYNSGDIDIDSGSGVIWLKDTTTVSGNFTSTGNTSVGGNLSVAGNLDLTGDITLDDVTLGDNMTFTGDTSLANVDISGYVRISGVTTLSGAAVAEGTLAVTGQANFTDDIVVTNLDAQGYMSVAGTTTASGALVAESTLDVTGATTLGSTLDVTGATTLSDALSVVGLFSAQAIDYDFLPIEWGIDDQSSAPATASGLNGTHTSFYVRDFDPTTRESVHFEWSVPDNFVIASGIKYKVHTVVVSPNGASNKGVAFGLSAFSLSNGESLDSPYGVPVVVSKTGITASQRDLITTGWSSAVTISGVSAGDLAFFKFYRDPDDGDDNYSEDVGVLGVSIKYVVNTSL